jgi:flavin reductase (DIM6/NTAB) family NADH-FMN oxidoreductase RutF
VISIPTIGLIDKVVGIGTCSGSDTDKFEKFKLTPLKAKHVGPPLISRDSNSTIFIETLIGVPDLLF